MEKWTKLSLSRCAPIILFLFRINLRFQRIHRYTEKRGKNVMLENTRPICVVVQKASKHINTRTIYPTVFFFILNSFGQRNTSNNNTVH